MSSSIPPPHPSATLYATTSKEWVIPPKPRPGRKPKQQPPYQQQEAPSNPNLPGDHDQHPPTNRGRAKKTQNRAAQRAFRERKQTQVAELQARVRLFERGEVEGNVALQAVSKRLKEENDILRQEKDAMRQEIESIRAHAAQLEARLATIAIQPLEASALGKQTGKPRTNMRKRARGDPDSLTRNNSKRPKRGNTAVMVKEPTRASSTTPSSLCDESPHSVLTPGAFVDLATMDLDLASPSSPSSFQQQQEFYSCGMCSHPSNCLCQEYGLQPFNPPPASHGAMSMQLSPGAALLDAAANASARTLPLRSAPSILDNPPPVTPAVPLPKRPRKGPTQNAFLAALTRPSHIAATSTETDSGIANVAVAVEGPTPKRAGCSGDPTNCAACANNTFGKAFCNALRNSVCTLNPCPSCSRHIGDSSSQVDSQARPRPTTIPKSINPSHLSCCGDPDKCGGSSCSTVKTPPLPAHGLPPDPTVIAAAARHEYGRVSTHSVTGASSIPISTSAPHSYKQGEGEEDEEELSTDEVCRRIQMHPKALEALEDQSRLHQFAEIMLSGSRSCASSGTVSPAVGGGSGSGEAAVQIPNARASGSGTGRANEDDMGKPRLVPEDELIRCQWRITTLPKRNVDEGWKFLDHFNREFAKR